MKPKTELADRALSLSLSQVMRERDTPRDALRLADFRRPGQPPQPRLPAGKPGAKTAPLIVSAKEPVRFLRQGDEKPAILWTHGPLQRKSHPVF